MSGEKWTPGPWSVNGLKALLRYGRKCDGSWAEEIQDDEYLPDENCAHIIAAAPDLYAALKSALLLVDMSTSYRRQDIAEMGKNALKKARGES